MRGLYLERLNAPNRIVVADERDRPAGEVHPDAAASVTLEAADSSWGEFLTLADVAELHAWTGALLAHAYGAELDL